jgi:hypothetical protein
VKRRIVFVIILILLLAVAVGGTTRTLAQGTGREIFRETGHSVSGEFLAYYRSVKNATLLFGYPITEQFIKDGRLVQYFQRARFEFYPEFPAGQQVQLTLLGRETYAPGKPAVGDPSAFGCRAFPETGFSVCHAFLEFFDKHGGAAQFGSPISGFEYRDKLIVQYFEKARFEWRPSMPEGQHVGLTDLGRIFFDQKHEDVNLLKPLSSGEIGPQAPLAIKSRAFTWKAVTLSSDQQLIYVVVQDQTLQPVAGATGNATIRWPDGRTETLALVTNSNGFGVVPLSFNGLRQGSLVTIHIVITKEGLVSSATTSFRIWY